MKKIFKTIYRITLILIGIYGLYLNFKMGNIYNLLHYYTILSNILVIVFFTYLLFSKKDHILFKSATTMCIILTFLVFHFVLRPTMFSMDNTYCLLSPSNLIVHYIIPIMTFIDYLIFDIKGKLKNFYPLLWAIIPYVYFIIMTINGALGYTFYDDTHYPYFFMDYDALGVGKVLINVLLLTLFYILLGYIYYGVDYLLKKLRKKYD